MNTHTNNKAHSDSSSHCFWQQALPQTSAYPPLSSDVTTDVAIVGGGFTGLWTAYYLKQEAPNLSVAIFEARYCGFGASGRNGGWLMGNLAGEGGWMPQLATPEQDIARKLITGIVDEVKGVCQRERIDCDLAHGGTLYIAARYPEQERSQRAMLDELRSCGYTEENYRWLSAAEMAQQINTNPCYGGIYTPHTAAIHPGKLVAGLIEAVTRLGVEIYETSPVAELNDRQLLCNGRRVKADITVNATEGYNPFQPKLRPYSIPVQSQVGATEPLSQALWQEIGIDRRQTFAEASRLITYAQRTADDRLVFGTRGNYLFGGRASPGFEIAPQGKRDISKMIGSLLPALSDVELSHFWTGSLAIAKQDTPYALYEPHTGRASAGGYGGEGVGATNLMARTLVDQIFHKQSELTEAPWANLGLPEKQLPRWEPEPLRWMGYKGLHRILQHEESLCENRNSPDWYRRFIMRFAGFLSKTFL